MLNSIHAVKLQSQLLLKHRLENSKMFCKAQTHSIARSVRAGLVLC